MMVETADDLYGLPLDRFVPERTVLSKALKASGETDQAAHVAALKKPSVAAWAVNQVVRTQPAAIRELFAVGDALAAASSQGGGDPEAIRSATRQLRDAVSNLQRAAVGLLTSEGVQLAPTTIDRVVETLRAAALDPGARDDVVRGCLTRELQFAGFGLGLSSAAPPPRPGRSQQPQAITLPAPDPEQTTEFEAEQRAREEEERLAELRREAAEHKAQADLAFGRARDELAQAEEDHRDAVEALNVAEQRLDAAQAASVRAADALQAAEQRLSELGEP